VTQTSTQRYRAGMPQLSFTGLSENWLLKTCGQHHWDLLAKQSERASSEMFDDVGSRSYAAFTAIRLRARGLDAISEDCDFTIDSALSRVGQARHFSTHRVSCSEGIECHVDMVSTFVKRRQAGSNRSIARATLNSLNAGIVAFPPGGAELPLDSKRFRAPDPAEEGAMLRELGLAPLPEGERTSEFLPCPNGDFNGADLLYFASFQAITDRTEWQRKRYSRPPVTVGRDLHFYGNVDLGDALVVHVLGERIDETGVAHWCRFARRSDGEKIADVVTHKQWVNR
jgi:probable biosynthetic protein (TIGR04099 family)